MRVDRPGGGDQALAGDDGGAGADHHVDVVEHVGVAGAARPQQMRPSRMPIETLPMRRVASITTTLEITMSQVSLDGSRLQQQAVAGGLAEPGQELVAALLRVVLDLDDQPGVAEPHPVAHGRPVDRGVVVGQDLVGMQVVVRHGAAVVAVLELAVRVPVCGC